MKTKAKPWCGRRDLNPHAREGRRILSPLRLPFRHFRKLQNKALS